MKYIYVYTLSFLLSTYTSNYAMSQEELIQEAINESLTCIANNSLSYLYKGDIFTISLQESTSSEEVINNVVFFTNQPEVINALRKKYRNATLKERTLALENFDNFKETLNILIKTLDQKEHALKAYDILRNILLEPYPEPSSIKLFFNQHSLSHYAPRIQLLTLSAFGGLLAYVGIKLYNRYKHTQKISSYSYFIKATPNKENIE